ncbi:hypothetical protein MMC07_003605 [Pseudocyphellaria aurata]|nr:hypothetical protein [Pseudocyphellaria aurata]
MAPKGGKEKADRRVRHDSDDDDRYGRSRRDNGNRARDRSESRSRSRTRHETRTMVKRGESSRAGDDDRWNNTDLSRAKRRPSNTNDEEEDIIKISRYITADFKDMASKSVEELCALLDVREGKVKQWCDRGLIRIDNTTKHLDAKPLIAQLDAEDARKLERFLEKVRMRREVGKIQGGGGRDKHYDRIDRYDGGSRHGLHGIYANRDESRYDREYHRYHDDSRRGHDHVLARRSRQAFSSADRRPETGVMIGTHPSSGLPVVAFCKACFDRAELCDMHSGAY